MAKRMQVSVNKDGLNLGFEVAYQPLAKSEKEKPKTICMSGGSTVKLATKLLTTNKLILPGQTARVYVDESGDEVPSNSVTTHLVNDVGDAGDEIGKVSQTKVFDIIKFIPMTEYNDTYIFDKYYELVPSNNGLVKDRDRQIAIAKNHVNMHALWEHLSLHNVAAIAEFNASSAGFISGYGCIRPVYVDDKWTLELGAFKEKKCYSNLTSGKPAPVVAATKAKKGISLL